MQYGTPQYCSAKLAAYFPPNVSLMPPATGASSTSAPSGMTGLTGTTDTTSNSGPSLTTTGRQTFASYEPSTPAPFINGSLTTVPDGSGRVYQRLAGIGYRYYDLPSTNVQSLRSCIYACDAFVPAPKGDSYDRSWTLPRFLLNCS